jgi:transmembrane sensor
MPPFDGPHDRILKQAMEWFVSLQSENCSNEDRTRFSAWLAQSEKHRAAYAEAEQVWASMDSLRKIPVPGLDEARRARPQPSALPTLLLSVLLTAVLTAGWWYEFRVETTRYATAMGERRSVTLADGSRIDLNTSTRIAVHWSRWSRKVELESGEALFSVTHDAHHPFVVESGDLSIRDVGTRFDVRKWPEQVTIAVLEGEVELEDARHAKTQRLKAGERNCYRESTGLGYRQRADAEQIEAWTHGRLVFRHAPLAEVAAELERYHPVRFVIADPALGRETLSGAFDADDLAPFLNAVEKILPVRAERSSGDTIVLERSTRR